MQRLSLNAFKAKSKAAKNTDQLLGQVLGNCHHHVVKPPSPRENSSGIQSEGDNGQ